MRRAAFHGLILASLLALMGVAAIGEIRGPSRIERIAARGELVVGMRPGAGTYYRRQSEEPAGFEYELLARFAKRVGLDLRVVTIDGLPELERRLDAGELDLVAAGIGPTPNRRQRFAFSRPFLWVQPQLIYREDSAAPSDLSDLAGHRVEVIRGTLHEARLQAARRNLPALEFTALAERSSEDLLYRVWRGRSDYAVTDSSKIALSQHFYPELRVAFNVGSKRPLAWMLRRRDERLRRAVDHFIAGFENRGRLAKLIETYFGHLDKFDYVGTRRFTRHVTERLPPLRPTFRQAARAQALDWRLLAAMGYQESLWLPDAVSPTGVRGIMMLTRSTAEQVDVADRTDPVQSIRGGARYLASVYARLPEDITPPDRRWFALAAYNVGLGHILDAREITRMQGADASQWSQVRERLPLLTQERWYSKVTYGYARGWEPVRYVENIRRYYTLLRRITRPGSLEAAGNGTTPGPALEHHRWALSGALQSAL